MRPRRDATNWHGDRVLPDRPLLDDVHLHISAGTGPSNPYCPHDLQRCTEFAVTNEPRATASTASEFVSGGHILRSRASPSRDQIDRRRVPDKSLERKPVPFRALTYARASFATRPRVVVRPSTARDARHRAPRVRGRPTTQPPNSLGCQPRLAGQLDHSLSFVSQQLLFITLFLSSSSRSLSRR